MDQLCSSNIASHLPRMAALQPDTAALHLACPGSEDYNSYSFRELEQYSNRIALALQDYGFKRGMRVALMVTPGLEFFALTFALFKLATVPVLVDPGIGAKNLKTCLAEAEPEAFIGIPKAHLARLLFGWGRGTVKHLVTVGNAAFWGGKSLQQLIDAVPRDGEFSTTAVEAEEEAAILFTSGSTGIPKGVVYNHGNFTAQVDQLKAVYDIKPGEVDLPTFPLFALFAPALGMSSVIPVMDFTRPGSVDPENIIGPIKRFNATTMFGSPALIDRVSRYGVEQGIQLPSLKRVLSAGAPVPGRVLQAFGTMLAENVELFTPYGATESLPVCSIGSREILTETKALTDQGRGVCVGHPVPSINLRIISISDEPIDRWDERLELPDGEIGEIVVQGPQVTKAYFNRPESTALAKIADQNGGFYHRMGDLGYRDGQGRIWFCGRKSHRVLCARKTLYTIPCEAVYNTHPAVFRSALVGVGDAEAQRPVICIELEKGQGKVDQKKIRMELLEIGTRYKLTSDIDTFLFHPAFPVDIRHNAKIFREKLGVWAAQELS